MLSGLQNKVSEFADSLKGSLKSAAGWTEALPSHLANEVATVWSVAEKAPKAIWNELSTDATTGFKGHPDRLIATAISGTIGAASLLLARRAPTIMAGITESGLMKGAAIVGATTEAGCFFAGTASLLGDGWNASTSEQRDKLGDKYSKGVASNVTPLIESAAAAGAGAVVADRALAYSPRFNVATFKALTERRDYFYRSNFITRDKLFTGKGSIELNPQISLGGNQVNMELLTKQLETPPGRFARALYSGDKNVEVLREADLSKMRASIPMRGTPWGNRTATIPEGITYHNHNELLGVQAGIEDVTSGTGLNIVRSGDYRSYYIGQRENLFNRTLPEVLASDSKPKLNQLVINDEAKRAFLLQREIVLDKTSRMWKPSTDAPQYVDYDAAKQLLKNIDVTSNGAAQAFEKLPKINLPLHPDDVRTTTLFTNPSPYDRQIALTKQKQ